MKKFIALAITAAAVAAANAQLGSGSLTTYADSNINGDAPDSASTLGSGRTWNIRSSGPVSGTSGIRYLTIEGSAAGSFAGWGLIEFDPTEVQAQLQGIVNSTPGATGYEITGVQFFSAQQQSSQPFSARSGSLGVYHAENDAIYAGSLSGADYFTNAQLGAVNTIDANYSYTTTPSAVFNFNEAGSDYSSVIDDWNDGSDTIRIILTASDANVVAPFKGSSSPFGGINAPSMTVDYNILPEPTSLVLIAAAALLIRRR